MKNMDHSECFLVTSYFSFLYFFSVKYSLSVESSFKSSFRSYYCTNFLRLRFPKLPKLITAQLLLGYSLYLYFYKLFRLYFSYDFLNSLCVFPYSILFSRQLIISFSSLIYAVSPATGKYCVLQTLVFQIVGISKLEISQFNFIFKQFRRVLIAFMNSLIACPSYSYSFVQRQALPIRQCISEINLLYENPYLVDYNSITFWQCQTLVLQSQSLRYRSPSLVLVFLNPSSTSFLFVLLYPLFILVNYASQSQIAICRFKAHISLSSQIDSSDYQSASASFFYFSTYDLCGYYCYCCLFLAQFRCNSMIF